MLKVVDRVVQAAMVVALVAIVVAMGVSSWDAVSGLGRGRPFAGAVEIATALMPVIVFGLLAYTQQQKQHIRVELLYANVNRTWKLVLDLVSHALMALFMGILVWQTWVRAGMAQSVNESASGALRFPIWPIRYVIAVGAALFILQLVADVIREVQAYRADRAAGRLEREDGFVPNRAAMEEAAEAIEATDEEEGAVHTVAPDAATPDDRKDG